MAPRARGGKKWRYQELILFSDEFNAAMRSLVREMNVPFDGVEYVTLCRERHCAWTLMGLDGCEYAEVRLTGLFRFEIEVILRLPCAMRWTIRRRSSLHDNLVAAFAAVALKRKIEDDRHLRRPRGVGVVAVPAVVYNGA